jgi:adenosylmethionine-8-amino-7-oxononanoate aminotransferase
LLCFPARATISRVGGNPIACAAALATISIIKEEGLANVHQAGKYFMVWMWFSALCLKQFSHIVGEIESIASKTS